MNSGRGRIFHTGKEKVPLPSTDVDDDYEDESKDRDPHFIGKKDKSWRLGAHGGKPKA